MAQLFLDFIAATFLLSVLLTAHLAAGRTMRNPRSSRRTCVKVATLPVNDVIETRSVLRQRALLDDRVPGAGPPASSLEGDVDLAEVTGSIVNNDVSYSTFHAVPRRVDNALI